MLIKFFFQKYEILFWLLYITELCKHMDIEKTTSDLKKINCSPTCTDASVVTAYKIGNYLPIETGFPCIFTI